MNSSTSSFSQENDALFSTLLPVLIQCFGVILLGYFAGKFKALTESQVRGLGTYVTKFALPSIFFSVMVTIDFTGVDWYVVLAVSLAKMIMFVSTLAITLIISRGQSVGLAGLLAMFTSQSNDVALAYPVLRLLYPDLASYIYLFAPAQLVILNPFAYFALEWHSVREKAAIEAAINGVVDPQRSGNGRPPAHPSMLTCHEFLKVIRFVVSNPLFFMTIIGVVFNFIFHHQLPIYVAGFFKTLGESFGATALFYLGFSMVGRLKTISRHGVHVLVLILLGKILVLPFITREVTVLLLSHQPLNVSVPKSSFTFLYAGAPTAPPVFLFASQYDLMPEVIGAGLVIGTFLFAPMMFLFAGMATLVSVDPSFYDTMLERTAVYFSWASILCCTCTLTILVVSRKALRMPYRFLVCLIISVLIFCLSVALGSIWVPWTWDPVTGATWGQYVKFSVFFVAVTAARIWTAFIALAVLLRQVLGHQLSLRLQSVFYILGFALPSVITAALLLTAHNTSVLDINPAFHYGRTQVSPGSCFLFTLGGLTVSGAKSNGSGLCYLSFIIRDFCILL
uniref:Integral membrane protein GPR155 n=1 Tax=Schistocephalus solidus TaxID=70667 RepID=A0A0X3PPL4_SCHSO